MLLAVISHASILQNNGDKVEGTGGARVGK